MVYMSEKFTMQVHASVYLFHGNRSSMASSSPIIPYKDEKMDLSNLRKTTEKFSEHIGQHGATDVTIKLSLCKKIHKDVDPNIKFANEFEEWKAKYKIDSLGEIMIQIKDTDKAFETIKGLCMGTLDWNTFQKLTVV